MKTIAKTIRVNDRLTTFRKLKIDKTDLKKNEIVVKTATCTVCADFAELLNGHINVQETVIIYFLYF